MEPLQLKVFSTMKRAVRSLTGGSVPLMVRSQKLQNESFRIFGIFVPNFAPNFAPNFPRIFRGFFVLRFVGDGDQKKFAKNPRHFSLQNSQANTKKIFTKFFWRAGKITYGAIGSPYGGDPFP